RESGHEVLVISMLTGTADLSFSGEFIQLDRPDGRQLDWVGFWQLKKIIDSFQPDIVQANASDTLRYGAFAKKLATNRFQLIYRNANMMSLFVKRSWQKEYYRFLLNQTDGVISVAEAARLDLIGFYGYKTKTRTIPIGIDPLEIDRLSKQTLDYDLPPSFLLFMGGFVSEKNPDRLLNVFFENHTLWSGLNLIFLGKGILENRLRSKIKEYGLENRVYILPSHSNPFPILKQAAALVLPSQIEGLPAVILEAMYSKVPVIANGVGGIPEVLINGKTGWCIPPNDSQALIQAIQEVMSMSTEAKQKILDQAHQLVITHYTLPQVTLQFEQFYKSLLDKN
ncbi:MAG: glycosyltransferase family 4 protein, partial [Cyclobacteriaceae bacterium]|nr:glycosyltransferase family 4 protein [Cyclobacteriaceae bacterium]